MCVQNLVPIGPQATTCIRSEGYTHRQTDTHTLSYIHVDIEDSWENMMICMAERMGITKDEILLKRSETKKQRGCRKRGRPQLTWKECLQRETERQM